MAKKHKHEEHVNMEAWVIPYADMLTLLFALFVVLYALGEIQLSKLKDVAKSVAFAFNFEGSGKTKEPGNFNEGMDGDGRVLDGAKLITAQKKAMKRLLETNLPEAFKQVTGNSLDIVQTDDTISFKAKLSSYFEKNQHSALRSNELTRTLSDLVTKTTNFSSKIRIHIEAPNVVIGRNPDDNTFIRSQWLCHMRLIFLLEFVTRINGIHHSQVTTEFRYQDGLMFAPGSAAAEGWEDRATVEIAFSN
jgi:chemotaxis protein MotB